MSKKNFTHAWKKGKKQFLGLRGTKLGLAHDLILMGDIKLTREDCRLLDIRDSSKRERERLCYWEWAPLLEYKGWSWVKL